MTGCRRVEFSHDPRGELIDLVSRRPRQTNRWHRSLAQFPMHFFPHLSVVRNTRHVDLVEGQPSRMLALIVAGHTVPIEELSVFIDPGLGRSREESPFAMQDDES